MKYLSQTDIWRTKEALIKPEKSANFINPQVLARFKQSFPFTLFCDELIIEDNRVIWIDNKGPWTKNIITVMASDIACVNASTGPILGHVHVQSLTGGPEIMVDRLFRGDASQARNLIEGIALAARNGVSFKTNDVLTKTRILLRAGNIN